MVVNILPLAVAHPHPFRRCAGNSHLRMQKEGR